MFVIVKTEFPAPSHDPATVMSGGTAAAVFAAQSATARAPARSVALRAIFTKPGTLSQSQ